MPRMTGALINFEKLVWQFYWKYSLMCFLFMLQAEYITFNSIGGCATME